MEELNLEDLNFESVQLFNEDGAAEAVKEGVNDDTANAGTGDDDQGTGAEGDKNNTIGDDQDDKSGQESVANKKEDNQVQARAFLAERLSQSLIKALESTSWDKNLSANNIVIIPIPSRRSADRKRGFEHIELLVKHFISMNETVSFQVLDCLRHSRKISDQSSLNFHERAMNMKGAFVVDQVMHFEFYPIKNSNSAVFLVDDLVTSGATVQAADLALSTLGARVDGVLASCATAGFTH